MRTPLLAVIAATMTLAACGGGGSTSTMPSSGGGSTQSSQTQSQTAIEAANALGDPVKTVADFNDTTSGTATAQRSTNKTVMLSSGVCNNGVEFWSPDKNGDPNSTQEQYFYDAACTQLARDVVRTYTIAGASETVNRTESQYAINNATAIASRTTTVNYVDGTYGSNGYPVVADGFARDAASSTNISGSKTIVADDELVMQAGSSGMNAWCGDSAGYNATGIAALGETFGWQGGVLTGGTRTLNTDGSVTWTATHAGVVFTGAIGSLSIASGSENTTCPIATAQYTLAGGTSQGKLLDPRHHHVHARRADQSHRHKRATGERQYAQRHHEQQRVQYLVEFYHGHDHQRQHPDRNVRGRLLRRRHADGHLERYAIRDRRLACGQVSRRLNNSFNFARTAVSCERENEERFPMNRARRE